MSIINFCPHCGIRIQEEGNFCPKCGSMLNELSNKTFRANNNKKERVLKSSSAKNKNIYWVIVGTVVILFMIIYYSTQPTKEYKIIKEQPKVVNSITYPSLRFDANYSIAFAKGGKIILPLDVVKEKKMVKFDFSTNNTSIPILAYLSEEGKVITAISMCEPCDSRDFHMQGSNLVCNSCGTTWNLNNLEAISGACGKYPPDPIPSKVVGNEIQIDENLVLGWTRRV
ncbi:DUF2318 domain-containing protein [Stygiobacter electus]|uniref:Fe-S-containing protein n=1 Tax=Stygiobacter electus TaxID=3032292 RepID=A0AAE3TD89_9BACT|nr:Fe-S-containing protein [Stygiobacter electus]MDF1612286.1 Fe-S-containing protein [Stygiobacter electus]